MQNTIATLAENEATPPIQDSPDTAVPHTNRLARERSPYLLQHQHNPVDWYAWSDEALERARAEDKPIFLSIGYSACHWCHVMERESFEDEAVSELVNEYFVPIKVDREERPDVDELYMTAVQMMTGSGGWPLSVFLTPDGRPFFGGTYFPPEDRGGRVGFGSLVSQLGEAWRTRREEIEQVADTITADLKRAVRQSPAAAAVTESAEETDEDGQPLPPAATPLDPDAFLQAAVADMQGRFDAKNGGFGRAPKFPPHHALRLLCHAVRRGEMSVAPTILTRTLDRMAQGGIYDHIGGGFHRYATDAVWLLPHFEKMLYDNALLARIYADAFRLTGRPSYARIARETCDWMLRDLQDGETGGFYAAMDADSQGEEGKYYVWMLNEARRVLGGDDLTRTFAQLYNMDADGNHRDEATGRRTGTNIPYLSIGESDVELPDALPDAIERSRLLFRIVRQKRVPPQTDDKIITAWNGLAIGALAFCGTALNEPRYVEAAQRAADFCLTTLFPESAHGERRLLRRYAKGEAAIAAYLDDHAFLADGLLDLYDANRNGSVAEAARQLADTMLRDFADDVDGGFFYTANRTAGNAADPNVRGHEILLARSKDLFDGALPSANGVAARALARLGTMDGGDERFGDAARILLRQYRSVIERAPQGTQTLIETALLAFPDGLDDEEALILLKAAPTQVTVRAGEGGHATFTLTIADAYHIAAYQPNLRDTGATVALVTSDLPAAVGPVRYPRAQNVGGESVYAVGRAELIVPIFAGADAAPGVYSLSIALRYSLCGNGRCLPPETQTAAVVVTIAASATA